MRHRNDRKRYSTMGSSQAGWERTRAQSRRENMTRVRGTGNASLANSDSGIRIANELLRSVECQCQCQRGKVNAQYEPLHFTGRVRSRTASINWKIAALAPMPRAEDRDQREWRRFRQHPQPVTSEFIARPFDHGCCKLWPLVRLTISLGIPAPCKTA